MPRHTTICRCQRCDQIAVISYNPGHRDKRICGDCRAAARRKGRKRVCHDCGQEIRGKSYTARFCKRCAAYRQARRNLAYMQRIRGGPPLRRRESTTVLQQVPDAAIAFCEDRDRRCEELRWYRD